MTKQNYIELFNQLHPNFFENQGIRNMPEEYVLDEMILPLKEFDTHMYDKKLEENVSFGFYDGDYDELREAVKKVDEPWVQYFTEKQRIYCGYIDGRVASFCIIDDMGQHTIDGCAIKVGGPGCVGTIPEYRDRGIGLTMVKHATIILKEEGYDYSYIHYTAVAPWYAKLGYKTTIQWNKNGVIS